MTHEKRERRDRKQRVPQVRGLHRKPKGESKPAKFGHGATTSPSGTSLLPPFGEENSEYAPAEVRDQLGPRPLRSRTAPMGPFSARRTGLRTRSECRRKLLRARTEETRNAGTDLSARSISTKHIDRPFMASWFPYRYLSANVEGAFVVLPSDEPYRNSQPSEGSYASSRIVVRIRPLFLAWLKRR